MDDPKAVQAVFDKMLDTSVTLTQRELLAISPELRKMFVDGYKVTRIPVFTPSAADTSKSATSLLSQVSTPHTAAIMELDIKIQGKHQEVGIFDPGAELVCISEAAARELGLPFSTDLQLTMRDANGGAKATFGIIENLQLDIGGVSIYVHAWIIKDAPYRFLLGRPFQIAAKADTEDIGTTLVMQDPTRPGYRLRVPMKHHILAQNATGPQCNLALSRIVAGATLAATSLSISSKGQVPTYTPIIATSNHSGKISLALPTPALMAVESPLAERYFREVYEFVPAALGLKYKPVDRKVKPVPTTMPKDAIPKRRFPEDPLASMTPLTPRPPAIVKYGTRLTKERWEQLKVDRDFLTEEEVKLAFEILVRNEGAIAWEDSERGTFRQDYFEPITIPTVEHEPWTQKAIPMTSTASNSVYQEEN
jgi:hypothetical protein